VAKKIKAWAGNVDNKIDVTVEHYSLAPIYAIYHTKKEAKKHYQCIFPIFITLNQEKRRAKTN
jgi:hypothetical protein